MTLDRIALIIELVFTQLIKFCVFRVQEMGGAGKVLLVN